MIKQNLNKFKQAHKKILFWRKLYNSLCYKCRKEIHRLGIRFKDNPEVLQKHISSKLNNLCPTCKETIKNFERSYDE